MQRERERHVKICQVRAYIPATVCTVVPLYKAALPAALINPKFRERAESPPRDNTCVAFMGNTCRVY